MEELPDTAQSQIYVDYLFMDFLKNYRRYFSPQMGGKYDESVFNRSRAGINIGETDARFRAWLVSFVKCLEPRYYKTGEFIQEQYEEIFEVVYIMKGTVGVGYRLFSETFYGVKLMMSSERKINTAINDYSSLNNKCSEFLYRPLDFVEALAMRKFNFCSVMKDQNIKSLKQRIATNYKYLV